MKAKIFSFVRVSDNSIVASVRLARFISDTLGIPIIPYEAFLSWDDHDKDPLDVLIIVGGAYAFSKADTLKCLGHAIENAGQVIWIQQDYTVIPPKDESGAESPFRRAFRDRHARTKKPSVSFWTTVQSMSSPGIAPSGHKCGEHSTYVNWNALAMDVGRARSFKSWDLRVCGETMLYYGSWRHSDQKTKDRVRYFDRYFADPTISVMFSCPNGKAAERFPHLMHETKLHDLYEYASEFGLGLYLEDGMSHKEFHSPANRFYEMLSAGLPMVFQPESQRMLDKAGYDVSGYVLWNMEKAPEFMAKRAEILESQRSAWLDKATNERNKLSNTLVEIWKKLETA